MRKSLLIIALGVANVAAFEADRHIESLYPVECSRGWVRNL